MFCLIIHNYDISILIITLSICSLNMCLYIFTLILPEKPKIYKSPKEKLCLLNA